MNRNASSTDTANANKFGTFKGVFTPSILTILGVIMFLRFGWVVGHGGLIGAILVVLLAHVISYTTGLSVSSIATNRTVKAGGDYYMISRSLGLPIGGAIGLALFFALALSTSLYILGFAESFIAAFQLENTLFNRQLIGGITLVVITGVTFFSTSLALKMQYFVLAVILLSLASLFLGEGEFRKPSDIQLWFDDSSASFETIFAVFFPAVTGFTAGVAMSGDLKDPRVSIPRGTLWAITVGLLMYLAIPVFLAFTVDPQQLRDDPMIWMKVARVPQLIVAGVFAATISSALGSVMGAPRYLQALAMDRVVPRFLGRGYGALNEPRIGTIVTFLVAGAGIAVGELDLIARIITMFFLTSYGFICLASGIQTWSGIASFRPDFKTPAWVSFLGAAVCLGIMFKLDTIAMVAATLSMMAIFAVLHHRNFKSTPTDTWGGFWAAVVQKGLVQLQLREDDSKNWRPNAIVFGGEPSERQHLVHLSQWMVRNRGIATYFYLIQGDIILEARRAARITPSTRDGVRTIYPEMFAQVAVTEDIYEGIVSTAQAHGLSGMKPNTVIMGWGKECDDPAKFAHLIRNLIALDHNLLLMKYDDRHRFGKRETIDICWSGLDRNGDLMLLSAWLISTAEEWHRATIRIHVFIFDDAQRKIAELSLKRILRDARVKAQSNIVHCGKDTEAVSKAIFDAAKDSDLTILGLRAPDESDGGDWVANVNRLIDPLRTVLLVRASSRFEGDEVLFDDEE
jgi:solute carrier family 12 (sodium/potassium/chloride transporter), member 2